MPLEDVCHRLNPKSDVEFPPFFFPPFFLTGGNGGNGSKPSVHTHALTLSFSRLKTNTRTLFSFPHTQKGTRHTSHTIQIEGKQIFGEGRERENQDWKGIHISMRSWNFILISLLHVMRKCAKALSFLGFDVGLLCARASLSPFFHDGEGVQEKNARDDGRRCKERIRNGHRRQIR